MLLFYELLLSLLTIDIGVLSYLDYQSTIQFLANGTGVEGNPIMAWVMKVLPTFWPVVKLIFIPIMIGYWYVALHGYPLVAVLFSSFIVAWYGYTVYNNYQIAAGKAY